VQKFNDFFVNIGPTLASKIQPTNTNYKEYLCGDYHDSFALFLTTPQEVAESVVRPSPLNLPVTSIRTWFVLDTNTCTPQSTTPPVHWRITIL